jgi:hypothetical protein
MKHGSVITQYRDNFQLPGNLGTFQKDHVDMGHTKSKLNSMLTRIAADLWPKKCQPNHHEDVYPVLLATTPTVAIALTW